MCSLLLAHTACSRWKLRAPTTLAGHGLSCLQVPRWAGMPSQLQQHWVFYAAASLASGYGAIFLFR